MPDQPDFDVQPAHQFFSAHCFNTAWELIEKSERAPEEDERMIQLAHASLWHWSQRPDVTEKNLSIGYWQLSRIYVLVGEPAQARKYAEICLTKTPHEDPFLMGYAHEALARAEFLAGNADLAQKYRAKALACADIVPDAESQKMLKADLEGIS